MSKKVKKQSLKKLLIMMYNVWRMLSLKLLHYKNLKVSLIQNIHPTTEISISKGYCELAHSIFTRRYVSLRAEGGTLKIGTSFFNQGCVVTALAKIEIGNNCLFGPNVVIVDHDHDYRFKNEQRGSNYIKRNVIIGNNVVVGANTVILKGTTIGDNCMIGAGCVISGKLNPGSLVYDKTNLSKNQIDFY